MTCRSRGLEIMVEPADDDDHGRDLVRIAGRAEGDGGDLLDHHRVVEDAELVGQPVVRRRRLAPDQQRLVDQVARHRPLLEPAHRAALHGERKEVFVGDLAHRRVGAAIGSLGGVVGLELGHGGVEAVIGARHDRVFLVDDGEIVVEHPVSPDHHALVGRRAADVMRHRAFVELDRLDQGSRGRTPYARARIRMPFSRRWMLRRSSVREARSRARLR